MEQTKEKTVKIKLPKVKNEPVKFVSVNERTWKIQRGIEVEVPECIAKLLADNEKMEDEADEYMSSVKN